ncbi:uncharacterized protein TNCT_723551 [Trichonephila clavata]|uniref:Uncharacterized protein n=1 Tax=Trichonephila clavata TaxID=2740835 RepID=A0A8X6LLL9_TRICU|nr:uncharacterized protein TNCT_723551 [Trichonephila clavata]
MRLKREVKVVLIFITCLLLAHVIEARTADRLKREKKVYTLSALSQPIAHSLQAQEMVSENKKQKSKNVAVKSTEGCLKGYKYDPFFKKCRKLVCALPGYKMMNEKCVKSC